jgi:hypothetical protein
MILQPKPIRLNMTNDGNGYVRMHYCEWLGSMFAAGMVCAIIRWLILWANT